jgi:hypothetical protein
VLIRIVAIVIITIISAAPAEGHHGFTGRYDRSKPLYIEGQITQATYMLPHGLITIEPSPPTPPPSDLFELSSDAYARLGGRDVVVRTQPIQATGGGVLVLLLTPPMTTDMAGRAAPPARGQTVGAIVFRECSTGELRVQLLRISPKESVMRVGVLQTEVDGCSPQVASSPPATPSAAAALPTAAREDVKVETRPRTDTLGALALLGIAGAAGLTVLVVALLLARRRR